MIIIYSLSFIIVFISKCHCYSNENDNVSLKNNPNKEESLPDPEALSFLRPTFVKVPAFLPPPPPPARIKVPFYRNVDRMDTGIDRMDTEYQTRYQNPVHVNRGFEQRQRPFGFQTRRPEISTIRREGIKIPYSGNINPGYNIYPNRVLYDDSQSMKHFPVEDSSSTVYSYRGDDGASVEGSGLFRHITTEDIGQRFDPYGEDETSVRNYINDEEYNDEGTLQAALKALWNYK